MIGKLTDLMGVRFTDLVVIARAGSHVTLSGKSHPRWRCRCDCGSEVVTTADSLRRGDRKSCGCRRWLPRGGPRARRKCSMQTQPTGPRERVKKSPEYLAWSHMKERCLNPNAEKFPAYGGRGIMVCARWLHSFPAFVEDMGLRPAPDLSLDRINNGGNYEPGNCRWATRHEQSANRRPRPEWIFRASEATA